MTGLRLHLHGIFFTLVATLAAAQSPSVTLTPAVVEPGSPVLIRVDAPAGAKLEGDWLGRRLQFFPGRRSRIWFALAGVDVETPPGPSKLQIVVDTGSGARNLSSAVPIQPSRYRTSSLTVANEFVEPSPETLQRIQDERHLKEKIFASSAQEPLWTRNFLAPVAAPATASFGVRRIFNGKLPSIHKGMDFRARIGTPVRAANSGVVVLARSLYYEGNCVVIDHGLGLFTISMHLSSILVQDGQRVAAGQRIGLSGATGRTTAPHLHWAVRWQGAYLDPAKLLRLNLAAVR